MICKGMYYGTVGSTSEENIKGYIANQKLTINN